MGRRSDGTHTLIVPPPHPALSGDEPFIGIDGTVRDFWAFAVPDLRMNTTRGLLAEYIVWQALEVPHPARVEWDDFDVYADGIRVEVKSSAYLQAWAQARPSALVFTGLKTRSLPADGLTPMATLPTYNADVYVFCVQTATTHDEYDPLDVHQWRFAVLPRSTMEQLNVASITWTRVLSIGGGYLGFDHLGAAIRAAAAPS